MGTDAHIVVVGDQPGAVGPHHHHSAHRIDQLADAAVARVAELEQLWSRFLPDSEISVLNRDGSAAVSPDTFALIDRAILGWRLTNGYFDPTQLSRLEQLGYDRPFDQLDTTGPISDAGAPADSLPTGCAGIALCPYTCTVTLPDRQPDGSDGLQPRFDPGGIGKGFAADLVVEALLADGAVGAMVSLGGDLRVGGLPPAGSRWVIEIGEAQWSDTPLAVVELEQGAVTTSTTLRRRWSVEPADGSAHNNTDAHHLLDPFSGLPARGGPSVVSVIAAEGWWAEVLATALAVGAPSAIDSDGTSGVDLPFELDQAVAAMVMADGSTRMLGDFQAYMIEPTWERAVTGRTTQSWNR